jgi:NADH-quinone oxidoreductase subunit L
MFRLYATTFLGKFRGTEDQHHHLHESPSAITIPLIVLAILAVIGGFLGIPEVFVKNANWLESFLGPVFEKGGSGHIEMPATTEWLLMAISTVAALLMVLYGLNKFSRNPELGEPVGFGKWMRDKFYVDEIYDALIVKPLNALGDFFNSIVEKKMIDGLVNGTGRLVQYSSRQLRYLQSGQVGGYVLLMVIGMVMLFVVQLFLRK